MLLRVEADDKRRDVDDLLADADVPLTDQDAGVVDRLGEARLEDLGLEATLEEVLDLEREDVIETHAGLVEDTDADQTAHEQGSCQLRTLRTQNRAGDIPADQGVSLKETLRVLLVELEELTSGTTDLGQNEGDPPDLLLVLEAILARELELGVETGRLVRTTRDLLTGDSWVGCSCLRGVGAGVRRAE